MADDFSNWKLEPAAQAEPFAGWKLQPAPPPSAQPVPDNRPLPTAAQAALEGAKQGATFGFADELGGAGQALLQFLGKHPTLQRFSTGQMFIPTKDLAFKPETNASGEPLDVADAYRIGRDENRAAVADAQKSHPGAYLLGAIGGGLATTPFIPGGEIKTLAGAAKTGAALGALAGLGSSTAKTPGQMLLDATGVSGAQNAFRDLRGGNLGRSAMDVLGSGALGGGIAGIGGNALGRAISPALDQLAVKSAKKVLTSGARQLATREPLSDEAARAALATYNLPGMNGPVRAIEPFGTTHGAYERLQDLTGHVGKIYGGMIDALDAAGVPGAEVDPVINKLLGRAADEELVSGANTKVPRTYVNEAQAIESRAMGRKNLPLTQAEGIKRNLQALAKYGTFRDTPINDARMEIASVLRQANEDAVAQATAAAPPGSLVRGIGEQFVPIKTDLGHLYEAEQAAREGAARSAHRGTFGLPEQMETARAFAEGNPGGVAASTIGGFLHSLIKQRAPSALATGALRASEPDLLTNLATATQRGYGLADPIDYQQAMADAIRNRSR